MAFNLTTILAALPHIMAIGMNGAKFLADLREAMQTTPGISDEEWAALHRAEAEMQKPIDERLTTT